MGDVLDGAERIGTNPTVTMWDEILCLRIIFTLKEEAQKYGGDIIWVLGNHDLAAINGDTSYIHETHAYGYKPLTRVDWFRPGTGILAFYMAKCGIIAGVIGNSLVSHAGLCKYHFKKNKSIDDNYRRLKKMTKVMRNYLFYGDTSSRELTNLYDENAVMMHRHFDIEPFKEVSKTVQENIQEVGKMTNTNIQVIGHNFRPSIQKV